MSMLWGKNTCEHFTVLILNNVIEFHPSERPEF